MTSDGAYAVYPGCEGVDISTALLVPFGFDEADSKPMLATVAATRWRTVNQWRLLEGMDRVNNDI